MASNHDRDLHDCHGRARNCSHILEVKKSATKNVCNNTRAGCEYVDTCLNQSGPLNQPHSEARQQYRTKQGFSKNVTMRPKCALGSWSHLRESVIKLNPCGVVPSVVQRVGHAQNCVTKIANNCQNNNCQKPQTGYLICKQQLPETTNLHAHKLFTWQLSVRLQQRTQMKTYFEKVTWQLHTEL